MQACEDVLESISQRQDRAFHTLQSLKNQIKDLAQVYLGIEHKDIIAECKKLGINNFMFKVVPQDYYNWNIEGRGYFLRSKSISQLCKTIIMENKKCTKSDCSYSLNSRFYCIVIQYETRLSTKKLFQFVRSLTGGNRNDYHFRVANEKELSNLTRSTYNGICPIGNKVNIPIIVSKRILDAPGGFIWLGGGTPRLKMGFDVLEFIQKTGCFVADIIEDNNNNNSSTSSSSSSSRNNNNNTNEEDQL